MRGIRQTLILVVLALVATTPAAAQSSSDAVLRDLLEEVRALRLTLQKSSLLGLRGNLLVERIRTAQERVSSTQGRLDSVRQQLVSLEQERHRFSGEVEDLEERISREYDQKVVEQLRQELDQYEKVAEMISTQTSSLKRNEAELLSRLDEDRVRLDSLEAGFDDLLREIERALESPE